MPKQDADIHVGEVPDIVRDGLEKEKTSPNDNEDESINFDEFFDLAVLQNDLLSSSSSSGQSTTSSSQMVLGISVLLTCLILSLSCNST